MCSRPWTVTRAPTACRHTTAHYRTIRSVTGESAGADPRHRPSTATAKVASTPARNVGTVRQHTHPSATCPDAAAARIVTAPPGSIPGWQQISPALPQFMRATYPTIPASRSRHGRNRHAPNQQSRRRSRSRNGRRCRGRRTRNRRRGRRPDHGRSRRNRGRGRRPRRNPSHSQNPDRLSRPRNPGPGRDRCPSRNPSQSRSPDRRRPRNRSREALQRELPAHCLIFPGTGHAYGHIQVPARWPQPDLSHRLSAARPPHVILGWHRSGQGDRHDPR
jgi:hypothetical protein